MTHYSLKPLTLDENLIYLRCDGAFVYLERYSSQPWLFRTRVYLASSTLFHGQYHVGTCSRSKALVKSLRSLCAGDKRHRVFCPCPYHVSAYGPRLYVNPACVFPRNNKGHGCRGSVLKLGRTVAIRIPSRHAQLRCYSCRDKIWQSGRSSCLLGKLSAADHK